MTRPNNRNTPGRPPWSRPLRPEISKWMREHEEYGDALRAHRAPGRYLGRLQIVEFSTGRTLTFRMEGSAVVEVWEAAPDSADVLMWQTENEVADDTKASEAARMLGSIRTDKKTAASLANLANVKQRGKPREKDPLELACTCGAGTETVVGDGHKTTCPRGRLLYQRAKIAAKKEQPANADS